MQALAFTKHDNNKDSILLFFISSFLHFFGQMSRRLRILLAWYIFSFSERVKSVLDRFSLVAANTENVKKHLIQTCMQDCAILT